MALDMKYFVCKPRGDSIYAKASRAAMLEYAWVIREDDPKLAGELEIWIEQIEDDMDCFNHQGEYERWTLFSCSSCRNHDEIEVHTHEEPEARTILKKNSDGHFIDQHTGHIVLKPGAIYRYWRKMSGSRGGKARLTREIRGNM